MTNDITLIEASFVPRLVVQVGGQVVKEVDLQAELSIGRAEDNDLQLMDPKASRHHARLHREGPTYILTDLGSANGTRVNGVRLTAPHTLQHGERITIGDTDMLYQEPGRSLDETITMAEMPAAVQAAVGTQAARPGPSAVPPLPPKVGPRSRGMSQGLVIGLVIAAAVVLLALVAWAIYLVAPGVYEQIGLIRPASPTPEVVASPTSPGAVETPSETPAPTTPPIDLQEMDDLLVQAEALARRSKFEDAVAIYEDLAERAPDDARPEVGWACALILDDRADEALPHAIRARELDPTSADAAAALSRAHIETGNETQALALAQEAVQLDPGSAKAHAALAEAYRQDGQIQGAVDEADLALVQDINYAEAHRARGWLYFVAENDLGRAASELQIAAGLQPELWLRRHELGMLLLEAEDYVTAIMAFQDALAIRPKAKTYTAIGEAYYHLGQYDQAKASLQQALSAGAEDVDTYALLAASLAYLDRCDDAETYWEQALDLDPSHPLASEAKDVCERGGPSPSPSPTTDSGSQVPSGATPGVTPQSTKAPSPPASLSGRIAFPVWNAQIGKYDTYVANVDGSGRSLAAAEMHQPAFSRDGKWLAVNGQRSNYEHLCIVRPDGSGLQEITAFLEDGQPYWSLTGGRLAFASFRHGDKQFRIYIIDGVPFGGGKTEGRTLNYGPDDVRGQMPAWTSDNRIVFRGCGLDSPRTECRGTGLYIMSAEAGPHTPKQLTEEPGDARPAVYGDKVAFMSNRDGNWEIYIMNLDGSDVKRLTSNAANDGLPTWSPDGKSLAFISNQGGAWAVWAMNVDGSNRDELFDIGQGALPNWEQEQISWGP
jgi:beta propeller repeat protein